MLDDGQPFGLGDGEHRLGAIEDPIEMGEGQAVQVGSEGEQHHREVGSHPVDGIHRAHQLMTGDDHHVRVKSGNEVRDTIPAIQQVAVEQATELRKQSIGQPRPRLGDGLDEEVPADLGGGATRRGHFVHGEHTVGALDGKDTLRGEHMDVSRTRQRAGDLTGRPTLLGLRFPVGGEDGDKRSIVHRVAHGRVRRSEEGGGAGSGVIGRGRRPLWPPPARRPPPCCAEPGWTRSR